MEVLDSLNKEHMWICSYALRVVVNTLATRTYFILSSLWQAFEMLYKYMAKEEEVTGQKIEKDRTDGAGEHKWEIVSQLKKSAKQIFERYSL